MGAVVGRRLFDVTSTISDQLSYMCTAMQSGLLLLLRAIRTKHRMVMAAFGLLL